MNRRTFVATALAGASLAPFAALAPVRAALQTTGAVDVVERFGFVPDGRTDNYDAFHRFAAEVNRRGGGRYVFPPGTYYVGRYRGEPGRAEVRNSVLRGCDGLALSGAGAKILLNGRYHRGPGQGRLKSSFMPFDLWNCRNVRISGFEIDGGVRNMTRDPGTTEIYSHLIALNGCVDVVLEDLDLHHSQTDGVYLYQAGFSPRARAGTACRNVTLTNVRCHNNARGGLAALNVYGLLATDCRFSENGTTGLGTYRGHAPGFGVDVEPDQFNASDVDVKTGNLEFRRCQFNDNISAILAAYAGRYRGYLRVIDCTSSNRFGHPNHMIVAWPGALVQGGRHDAGKGTVWTAWQQERGGDLTLRGTEILTSGLYGVFHAFPGNLVRLEDVRITGTHSEPGTHGIVLGIQADPGGGRRNVLRGCEIFIPAARRSRKLAYDYEVSLHRTLSEGNLFRTDLPAAGGAHFCTEYAAGTVARGDRYRGTAPGPGDSFRPYHMARHDSRQPFSKG